MLVAMRLACALVMAMATSAIAAPGTSPLDGPFATPEAFLAALQRDGAYAGEQLTIDLKSEHAMVMTVSDGSRKSAFLAVKTGDAWLVDRVLGDGYDARSTGGIVLHDNLRDTYALIDLVEHGGWIVLRAMYEPFFRTGDAEYNYCLATEVVCRRGGACSVPIPVAGAATCDARKAKPASDFAKLDWHRDLTLRDDGVVVIPRAKPRLPTAIDPVVARGAGRSEKLSLAP